jgi:hypothetical protein
MQGLDFSNWRKWKEVTQMEFPWPQWMEFVLAGGTSGVCVVALRIIDRFQRPKE